MKKCHTPPDFCHQRRTHKNMESPERHQIILRKTDASHVTVQNVLFRIHFGTITLIITLLPFFSMIICLLTSMIFQFEQVNVTFCGTTNLPSISAVTGARPQIHLWRFCIALHCAPRFLIALIYRSTYLQNIPKAMGESVSSARHHKIVNINFVVNIVENISLLLVSVISSPDNYVIHEKCFMTFMFTSTVYMMLSCYLYPILFFQPFLTEDMRRKSLKWKRRVLAAVLSLGAGVVVFFLQHRIYCVAGAYTRFAFCEYWLAIMNMAFHLTCVWDFNGKELIIAGSPREILSGTNGDASHLLDGEGDN